MTEDDETNNVIEASANALGDDVLAQYTSHPISNYSLGRFQFENSILKLTEQDDVDEFEKLLSNKNLPPIERGRVKKIDLARAEEIVRARLSQQRKITQAMDSSIGDAHRNPERIGKQELGGVPAGKEAEPAKVNPLAHLNVAK